MATFVRMIRLRLRLRLVWRLTRHPRFKPLYRADVVSYSLLDQAEFLADAGYQTAAAMMARNAIESRFKRAALISPKWRSLRRGKFCQYVGHLLTQGVIGKKTAQQADRFYSMASDIIHGKHASHARCMEIFDMAHDLDRRCDGVIHELLRGRTPEAPYEPHRQLTASTSDKSTGVLVPA